MKAISPHPQACQEILTEGQRPNPLLYTGGRRAKMRGAKNWMRHRGISPHRELLCPAPVPRQFTGLPRPHVEPFLIQQPHRNLPKLWQFEFKPPHTRPSIWKVKKSTQQFADFSMWERSLPDSKKMLISLLRAITRTLEARLRGRRTKIDSPRWLPHRN